MANPVNRPGTRETNSFPEVGTGLTVVQKSNEWIPRMAIFKRSHLFQTIILGIHVSFQGCRWFLISKKDLETDHKQCFFFENLPNIRFFQSFETTCSKWHMSVYLKRNIRTKTPSATLDIHRIHDDPSTIYRCFIAGETMDWTWEGSQSTQL